MAVRGEEGETSEEQGTASQAERPPQLSKTTQHQFLAYADFLSQKGLARLLPALHQCVAESLHKYALAPCRSLRGGCEGPTGWSSRRTHTHLYAWPSLSRREVFSREPHPLQRGCSTPLLSSAQLHSTPHLSSPPLLSSAPLTFARGGAQLQRGCSTHGPAGRAWVCSVTIKSKLDRAGVAQLLDAIRSRYRHAAAMEQWSAVLLPPADYDGRAWRGGGGGGEAGGGAGGAGSSGGGGASKVRACVRGAVWGRERGGAQKPDVPTSQRRGGGKLQVLELWLWVQAVCMPCDIYARAW
jgi:hypothetical protein